ncbi:MAG: hypothetical protein JW808_07025, partial [Victivallales bacterium]|nr:hypothetical protein [Victivallales bacterium]
VGTDGELLLPIKTGMLCRPAGKSRLSDRFLIYGEQERWELLPLLPVCGASDETGGLVALATRCASDTECRAETDGKGSGRVGFAFSFRRYWHDPIDWDRREIRLVPMPKGESITRFSAKRLRRHVIEDLGKPLLRERIKESPELAYFADAYIMKLFMSIENDVGVIRTHYTPGVHGGNLGSFDIYMTCAEAKECLKKLHDAGLNNILVEMTGWNPRGHDGMYPTRLPPDERIGGEAGFRDLMAYGNSLGFNMSVHDNYIDAYEISPDFNADWVIHGMDGNPLVCGWWAGGKQYRHSALHLPEERVEGQMRKMQELGVRGLYYCDAMGNPLEVNYHPKLGGPRSCHARGISRILKAMKSIFGAAQTECAFLYTVVDADAICTTGWNHHVDTTKWDWPILEMCDEAVPLWNLALHDLIILEGHGDLWDDVMLNILLGRQPRTQWCARPGTFPVLDDQLIAAFKANYELSVVRFGYLKTLEMTDYRRLGPDTFKTVYADGTEVVADFSKHELLVNGERIPRPSEISLE